MIRKFMVARRKYDIKSRAIAFTLVSTLFAFWFMAFGVTFAFSQNITSLEGKYGKISLLWEEASQDPNYDVTFSSCLSKKTALSFTTGAQQVIETYQLKVTYPKEVTLQKEEKSVEGNTENILPEQKVPVDDNSTEPVVADSQPKQNVSQQDINDLVAQKLKKSKDKEAVKEEKITTTKEVPVVVAPIENNVLLVLPLQNDENINDAVPAVVEVKETKEAEPLTVEEPVVKSVLPAETKEAVVEQKSTQAPTAIEVKAVIEPAKIKKEKKMAAEPSKKELPIVAPVIEPLAAVAIETKKEKKIIEPVKEKTGSEPRVMVTPKIMVVKPEKKVQYLVSAIPGRSHVVGSYDTLPMLAEKYYYDKARWVDIYQANEDKIEKGNIKKGQVLIIP